MFNPSRTQVRGFFTGTWAKYQRGEALSALEQTALEVMLLHPEYHGTLSAKESVGRDFSPESGELNPFLHLSLHLAIEEQLSIDQPRGIRASYERLKAKTGSEHDAKHRVLECLGETLWASQRAGTAPDEHAYIECVERGAG